MYPHVEPTLCTVGDIAVTQSSVILPGGGRYELRGTTWVSTNNTITTSAIPVWAIVMCIMTIWLCLFGLLFLLAKEQRTSGAVQVSVQGPGLFYVSQMPVSNPLQIGEIEQRVNFIRGLVAQLG